MFVVFFTKLIEINNFLRKFCLFSHTIGSSANKLEIGHLFGSVARGRGEEWPPRASLIQTSMDFVSVFAPIQLPEHSRLCLNYGHLATGLGRSKSEDP